MENKNRLVVVRGWAEENGKCLLMGIRFLFWSNENVVRH